MTYQRLRQYRSLLAEISSLKAGSSEYRKVQKEIEKIKSYVENLDDSFTRRIFRLKYIEKRTDCPHETKAPLWNYVAKKVGSTEDYCKKIHHETLSKNKSHK